MEKFLAIVSSPSYNPAELVAQYFPEYWQKNGCRSAKLLMNRATQGAYAPGSTFKIVTAIAALERRGIKTRREDCLSRWFAIRFTLFQMLEQRWSRHDCLKEAIASFLRYFFLPIGFAIGCR